MNINRVTLSGHLTRDVEVRATRNGTSVATFGIAVNERRPVPGADEYEEYANFFECVLFGSFAEKLGMYVSKGSKVVLGGKLRYSSWEKDGQRRSKVEVVVLDLDFMDGGKQQRPQKAQPVVVQQADMAELADDDIPF